MLTRRNLLKMGGVSVAALGLGNCTYSGEEQTPALNLENMVGGVTPLTPEDFERRMEKARRLMADIGVACEVFQSARGMAPGEDLVDYARDSDIDMIVVGVEKRSRTQKILLGSTAQYIILKAPCPVLTVK